MFDDLPDPRRHEPTEASGTNSEDRGKKFEQLPRRGPAETVAERAFLESKLELIRNDPQLSDEEKDHAICELQGRARALDDTVLAQLSQTRRLLWFILIATLVWGSVISWEGSEYRKQSCPTQPWRSRIACLSTSPIAELELATTPETFRALINRGDPLSAGIWNLEITRVNTYMDFLFIALYWSVFVLFASLERSWLTVPVILAISVAALFDVVENTRLLGTLQAINSRIPFSLLPGHVSRMKWIAFAASLLLLGLAFAKAKIRCSWLLSALVFASAVSTAIGVSYVPVLFLAILFLALAVLISVFVFSPSSFRWGRLLVWLEFAYLIRFQILAGMLLGLIFPSCIFLAPSIFIGIFDALGFWSMVFIVAASFQLAWTIMITSRLVLVYGPDRFPGIADMKTFENPSWAVVGLYGGLALPCILMTCCGTSLMWYSKLSAIVIGLGISLAILWVTAKLHFYIEPQVGKSASTIFPPLSYLKHSESSTGVQLGRFAGHGLQRLLSDRLKPGVLSSDQRLRSGHQLALTALTVLLILYVLIGVHYSPTLPVQQFQSVAGQSVAVTHIHYLPERPLTQRVPAALFYVLCLLVLFTWCFSGMAFFLDVLRIPVLTSFIAVSFVFSLVLPTDHQFNVTVREEKMASPSPEDVIQRWKDARGKNNPSKPIVVIATAGGGIRAAMWTTEVIAGLTKACQLPSGENAFTSSLMLVSSVSGGSVGSMYAVGSFDSNGQIPSSLLERIPGNASRTSLSAVGWGLLYPDVLRTIPLIGQLSGKALGSSIDRGWALENEWLRHWDAHLWDTPPTLAQWQRDVFRGTRPAVIFNATASESGDRFLIGSTRISKDQDSESADKSSIQFITEFENYDVPIASAARLSATFPWVTPMAHASHGTDKYKVHVADGGYYDNSGVLSATQWLLQAQGSLKTHPVVFILIDSTPSLPKTGEKWSWQRQVVAPVGTLLAVRTSSQQMRADYEFQLATDYLNSQHIGTTSARLLYPSDPILPLSWHLTKNQVRNIEDAWSNPGEQLKAEISKATAVLGCHSESM